MIHETSNDDFNRGVTAIRLDSWRPLLLDYEAYENTVGGGLHEPIQAGVSVLSYDVFMETHYLFCSSVPWGLGHDAHESIQGIVQSL